MRTQRSLIVGLVAAILLVGSVFVALTWRVERLDPFEHERRETFERHAMISEQARASFEQLYNRLPRDARAPEDVAGALELDSPLPLAPRPDGGQEARVEMADKYSRLILMWDESGEPKGYAWEIDTPASDDVTWSKHHNATDRTRGTDSHNHWYIKWGQVNGAGKRDRSSIPNIAPEKVRPPCGAARRSQWARPGRLITAGPRSAAIGPAGAVKCVFPLVHRPPGRRGQIARI